MSRLTASLSSIVVACVLAACERRTAPVHDTTTDDFGDTIVVAAAPARIVSLNPTTTELLYAIGAGARLVVRGASDETCARADRVQQLGRRGIQRDDAGRCGRDGDRKSVV